MAIARTQTATIKTAGNVHSITSNTLTTVAGRSLFCAASGGISAGRTWQTPTDSKGNTWTISKVQATSTLYVMIGHCLAPATVGASHTVTCSFDAGTEGDMCIAFAEYSGVDSAGAVVTNSNNGTGTAVTTGAAVPSGTNMYLVAENNAGSPTITPNSPWTQVSENESGSSAQPLNLSEQLNTTGSQNGDWTLGSSQAWVSVIATFVATGGATAYTRTVTDNLGLSELAFDRLAPSKRVLSDNLGISDTINRLVQSLRILTDTKGLSDTPKRTVVSLRLATDIFASTDTEVTKTESKRTNPDNLGLTDTKSTTTQSKRVSSDNLALTDTEKTTTESKRGTSDSIGLADTEKTNTQSKRTNTDTIGMLDTESSKSTSSRTNTDNIGLSDSSSRKVESKRTTPDTLALSDSFSEATTSFRTLTDSIGVQDSIQRIAACLRAFSDNLGVQDVATVTGPGGHAYTIVVADSLGFSDVSLTVAAFIRVLQESLGTQDAVARAISVLLKITDTLGFRDSGRLSKFIPVIPTIFLTAAAQTNMSQVGMAQRNIAPTAAAQTNMLLTASAGAGP